MKQNGQVNSLEFCITNMGTFLFLYKACSAWLHIYKQNYQTLSIIHLFKIKKAFDSDYDAIKNKYTVMSTSQVNLDMFLAITHV